MMRRYGVGTAAVVLGAVALSGVLAGCGDGKTVTFQPADGPAGSTAPAPAPAATATVTTTAPPPAGVTTDPGSGVVISRNGSTICVRGRNGGTACTSSRGTVVVDGVTISDGVVVGGGGAVTEVTPRPTSGQVRLSGAVAWSGKATGTCEGHGTGVRTVRADVPSVGRLVVHNVGDGVLRVTLDARGSSYGLSYVGRGGPVRSTDSRLIVDNARLGRSGSSVLLTADFDC